MKKLFWIMILVGCASQPKGPSLTAVDKKIAVEKRGVAREPGSLWSEGSYWNSLFTDVMPRKVGDIIKVRYTESLREWLSKRLKKDLKGKSESAMVETDMSVQIQDVFAGGVFQVTGSRQIKFVDESLELKVQATVREKDLQTDDSVNWDQLFNLNISVEAPKA